MKIWDRILARKFSSHGISCNRAISSFFFFLFIKLASFIIIWIKCFCRTIGCTECKIKTTSADLSISNVMSNNAIIRRRLPQNLHSMRCYIHETNVSGSQEGFTLHSVCGITNGPVGSTCLNLRNGGKISTNEIYNTPKIMIKEALVIPLLHFYRE